MAQAFCAVEGQIMENPREKIGLRDQDGAELQELDLVLYQMGRTNRTGGAKIPEIIWRAGLIVWNATEARFSIVGHEFDIRPRGADVVEKNREAYLKGDYRTFIGQLRAENLTTKEGFYLGGEYPAKDQLRCRGVKRIGELSSIKSINKELVTLGVNIDFHKIFQHYYHEIFTK